jgi:hypothetical protein
MRGQHFASLFAAEDEDEDGGDAEAPVWGESDYNVPGMGANHLRPRKRREVKVDQTAFPLFHKFIRYPPHNRGRAFSGFVSLSLSRIGVLLLLVAARKNL